MAITLVGVGGNSGTAPTLPAGVQAGDVGFLLFYGSATGSGSWAGPPSGESLGWHLIVNEFVAGGRYVRLAVYWKLLADGESGGVALGWNGNVDLGRISVWRGLDSTTIPKQLPIASGESTRTRPAITPTSAGSLILFFYGQTTTGAPSWTNNSFTSLYADTETGSSDTRTESWYALPGSTTTIPAGTSGSTGWPYISAVLEVDPIPSGGSGSASLDAIVRSTQSNSFALGSVLKAEQGESFGLDAVLSAPPASLALDAVLLAEQGVTFSLDAVFRRTYDADLGLSAVVRDTAMGGFDLEAVLLSPQGDLFGLNAVKRASAEEDLGLDALIRATQSNAFGLDAYSILRITGSLGLHAAISRVVENEFGLHAVVVRGQPFFIESGNLRAALIGFTLSADMIAATSTAIQMEATVTYSAVREFGLNAWIEE